MVPCGNHPLFAEEPSAEGWAGTHFLESGIYGKASAQFALFFSLLMSLVWSHSSCSFQYCSAVETGGSMSKDALWAAMCVPVLRSNGIAFSIRLSRLAFQCCFILTKCLSLPQLFLITLKCLAACLLYQRNQVNTTQSLCLEHLLCSGPLLWELRSWIRPGSHHQGTPSFPSFLDGFRIQEY